jgi:drug/metabolite transporter (DMT)-like permease
MFFAIALAWPAARAGSGVARRGTTPALLTTCGLLDASANALFLVATQHGMLTLVAVLGALYPASTLLLARAVLGERLAGWQRVGVAVALTAVVLVSAG